MFCFFFFFSARAVDSSIWHLLKKAANFPILLSNLQVLWLLFFDTLTLLKSYILGDPIFQFLISIPLKNILFTDKKWGCKQESIIGFDQRRYSWWCDHSPRARILECEVKWALGSTTMNKASWAISNPKRWCCESAALNMPANLENWAVAIRLEKVRFHSNPKERQCQRMLKLLHDCTHLTR